MSIPLKSIKPNLRGLSIYSLSFIVLFDFIFLKTFSDSGQTFGMFIIASFILQLLTIFFFILTTFGLQLISIRQNIIINSIILFLVSEISIVILTGDISLFGLFETHDYHLSTDFDNSMKFHEERDLALSTSGLLSCITYLALSAFRRR